MLMFLEVDGWITVKVSKKIADLVFVCRRCMSEALDCFVNACDGVGYLGAPEIPHHIMKVLDIIVECLSAEQVQQKQEQNEALLQADAEANANNINNKRPAASKRKY